MKIAIFENEYQQIEAAFEAMNLLYFDNKLEFSVFPSSQNFGPLENLKNYDIAIVDIDLSQNSQLDGYALLKKIENLEKKPKILVLTGSSKVESTLQEKKLPKYDVLLKPVDFSEIHKSLDKMFKK